MTERPAANSAFGTVDSWLMWNLTGGRLHVTDVTNASRTMLYDIHRNAWDDEMLALLQIPYSMLPAVRASSEVYGENRRGDLWQDDPNCPASPAINRRRCSDKLALPAGSQKTPMALAASC